MVKYSFDSPILIFAISQVILKTKMSWKFQCIVAGVDLEIFHHGIYEKEKKTEATESVDNEGEEISGVLTRTVNLSRDGAKKEKMVLHVANKDGKSSSVLAIKLNPDGTLGSIFRKERSIDDYKASLFGRSSEGVIARAKADDIGSGSRYTMRIGSAKKG